MTDQDICLVDLPLPPCSELSLPAFLVVLSSCLAGRVGVATGAYLERLQ